MRPSTRDLPDSENRPGGNATGVTLHSNALEPKKLQLLRELNQKPEPIIRRLAEVLIKMADDPEVKETMRKSGARRLRPRPTSTARRSNRKSRSGNR